jgi:hypothetical protein
MLGVDAIFIISSESSGIILRIVHLLSRMLAADSFIEEREVGRQALLVRLHF